MTVEQTIDIECRSEVIWQFLTDESRRKQWHPGLLEFRVEGEDPMNLGSKLKITINDTGKTYEYEGEVVQFDPGVVLGIRTTGGTLKGNQAILTSFVLLDGGEAVELTRIEATIKRDDESFDAFTRALVIPFARKAHKRELNEMLDRLKSVAEAHIRSGAAR